MIKSSKVQDNPWKIKVIDGHKQVNELKESDFEKR
jgi:hypothetical protein